ncbi:MAG: hypothetical protein ACRYFS_25715 [Janthinobacterium lividum]
MRLVLDPAEEAAHGEWLRRTSGAYEWWYFDALSDDGQWALTCIWFLGNPFSPYYRQSALGQSANPFEQNALFFALYRYGKLHAYHFTRFPLSAVYAAATVPLCLQFGPNQLVSGSNEKWHLGLADENANGRHLTVSLTFTAPPLAAAAQEETTLDSDHSWLPIAPFCRVQGTIELRETHNPGAEIIQFNGTGYHDHNWGRLPFDAAIRDWYWARAALSNERSVILYHVQPHQGQAVNHLLLFEQGRLLKHDSQAKVSAAKSVFNGFGTRYSSRLTVSSADLDAVFRFGARLDSAPFYIRAFCSAAVHWNGQTESGEGIGEYLRPRAMSWPLVASAMKARIVER